MEDEVWKAPMAKWRARANELAGTQMPAVAVAHQGQCVLPDRAFSCEEATIWRAKAPAPGKIRKAVRRRRIGGRGL